MEKYLLILLLTVLTTKRNSPTTCILIAKPTTIIGCGGILFAGQFFFINATDSSQFIGAIICPDGYGENFFKVDTKYSIYFSKDTVLEKKYSWMNVFEIPPDKKIPIKIINQITELK